MEEQMLEDQLEEHPYPLAEQVLGQNATIEEPIEESPSQSPALEQQIMDPVKELIENCNPLPILAVLQHYDLNQEMMPGQPLINLLCNKFLPLDIICKGQLQLKPDASGRTPLHYAVEVDDVKSAHWCLEHGNPNLQDKEHVSPIMIAIKNGYRRCFLLLLQYNHYDPNAAHIAAAYNRVWQLQVLNTLNYNFTSTRDIQQRTPIDVAVESYSYESAEYLAVLDPSSYNINKLQNLTDSSAIIRRIRIATSRSSFFRKTALPFVKVLLSFVLMLSLLVSEAPTIQYKTFFVIIFGIMLFLYGVIQLCNVILKKINSSRSGLMQLLKAPDFPMLQQICGKCLHFTSSEYEHCDRCGCCVKRLHFHDWVCINQSNESAWAILEFLWLYVLWHGLCMLYASHQTYSPDLNGHIPLFLLPFRFIEEAFMQSNLAAGLLTLVNTSLFVQQVFYCLEIFGIMFMGRTYSQVNNTQKYEHLYRVVKMNDGNFRNKEKRVFEDGLSRGILRGSGNIFTFLTGLRI